MARDCVVMVITQAFSYANNFETVVTVACWYIRGLEACLDGIMAFCCDSARRFSRSSFVDNRSLPRENQSSRNNEDVIIFIFSYQRSLLDS